MLAEGQDYQYELSRAKFEQLCESIWDRLIPPLTAALSDAKLTKQDIDQVILVGGSTRIPKV